MFLFYMAIWYAGIGYTMVRYRFLADSPELYSKDILANIDELVILLDTEYKIVHMNEKTIKTICPESEYTGKHFSVLIQENEGLTDAMKSLYEGSHADLSCRLNFIKPEDESVCMDAIIRTIKDKYNETAGILIIAKPVKGLIQLQALYRITGRECNVIQLAINGKTNHEIGDELNISERTVKAHLSNIFNKLGVDNKIKLIMFLKEFNLIPDNQADFTLFGS